MRSRLPPTLSVSSSDLHQVYRTWLCCAFRLLPPPDALIPLETLAAFFHAAHALGVGRLQRFPLSSRRATLTAVAFRKQALERCTSFTRRPSLHAVSSARRPTHHTPTLAQPRFQGFELPESPFSADGVTRDPRADPLLAVAPSGVSLPFGLDPVLPQGLLSWASVRRSASGCPGAHVVVPALQSFKEPKGGPTSFEACLPLWGPRRHTYGRNHMYSGTFCCAPGCQIGRAHV